MSGICVSKVSVCIVNRCLHCEGTTQIQLCTVKPKALDL